MGAPIEVEGMKINEALSDLDGVVELPAPTGVQIVAYARLARHLISFKLADSLEVDEERDLGDLRLAPGGYLEVRVLLERPEAGLRRRLEEVMEGKTPRLLKISLQYAGSGHALGDALPQRSLEDLSPNEVFQQCYARQFEGEIPEAMRNAFAKLLEDTEAAS